MENPNQSPFAKDDADFSFTFKPTPKTLFRFSALTFNSHLIHYDHVYSTTIEHQNGKYAISLY
jgi:3-methylfumaryl-CoA hydratase